MLLHPVATISTSLFSYDEERKLYVSELKRLGRLLPSQLYASRPDVGIHLRSPTGKITTFYLYRIIQHDDSVTCWIFRPIREQVAQRPNLSGTEVHVLNT